MSGPSPFECSVCMEIYNFDTPDRQAITLPCGHSFDRLCLSKVQHMKCPTCRASFAGDVGSMAPNFALRDAMLELVPATDPDVKALENLLGIEVINSMVLPSDALVLGEAISRAGGTCVVRRGTLRGVQVAVKVVHLDSDSAEDPLLKSLRRELLVIFKNTAGCPHVCRYLGVCKQGLDFCIVMQLYKQSLADYIKHKPDKKLSLSEALSMSISVARGLGELHGENIIACDLKPDNVLLDLNGHVVLSDFGISHVVSTTVGSVHPTAIAGTYNFMAPEQMSPGGEGIAGGVSCKADIWAFACTFINMITGQPPLSGYNIMQILTTVSMSRKPHTLPVDLPATLQALLRSCLDYDPAMRPTAVILLNSLRGILTHQQETSAAQISALQNQVQSLQLAAQAAHRIKKIEADKALQESSSDSASDDNDAAPPSRSSSPPHDVPPVHVDLLQGSLEEILAIVNAARVPTVFDLGGRNVLCAGTINNAISASDVMLRNGIIILSERADRRGPSLFIEGKRVKLELVAVRGGRRGVSVRAPGEVHLRGCVMEDNHCGLFAGSADGDGINENPSKPPAVMVAHLTHVRGCVGCAVGVFSGSSMLLTGCEIKFGKTSENNDVGVFGRGSRLEAIHCVCLQNQGRGLYVGAGGHARLSESMLSGNQDFPCVLVVGEGSVAELVHMALDGDIGERRGGKILFLQKSDPRSND